jgi:hypothetical protein
MVNVASRLLKHLKINPERLLLEWVSAAEGPRFAEVVTNFTNQIKEMGPLGADDPENQERLSAKLAAAERAVRGEKLRWVAAKQTEFMQDGNVYGEVFTSHEIGRILDGVIMEEVTLQEILMLVEKEALSVKEISEQLEIPSPETFRQVQALRRKELVEVSKIRDRSPLYTACDKGV